jgi:2-polyprenyl-3-methyl-5-hydroxy-6-metoxy-1,4-benzoquinol methylase
MTMAGEPGSSTKRDDKQDGRPATALGTEAGIACALCGCQVEAKSSIDVGALTRAYRRVYRVDISRLTHDGGTIRFHQCGNCGLQSFHPPSPGDGDFYSQLSRWFDGRFSAKWWAAHHRKDLDDKAAETGSSGPRSAMFRAAPPTLRNRVRPWDREEFEFASGFIEAGMSVLEVGCGKCAFWDAFREKECAAVRYIGLELDPAAVAADVARQIDVRAELIEDHAQAAAGQYDVVCFFQVLEHVVDLRSFLDGCLRCLKPGGHLIFSVPNARSFLGRQPDNILNMPPHHVTWWTELPIRYLAADRRLAVEAIVEDDLAAVHRGDFVKVLAMNYLKRLFRVPVQFELEGSSYRIRRYLAAIAARLLAPSLTGIEFVARGHSITAVLRKAPSV